MDPEFLAVFPEVGLEVLIVNNVKNQCNEESLDISRHTKALGHRKRPIIESGAKHSLSLK